MDIGAPVFRYSHEGLGGWTNDASVLATSTGQGPSGDQTVLRVNAGNTDTAAHAAPGDQWADAYGEAVMWSSSFTGSTGRRCGVWLRVVDASNCYTVVADGGSGGTGNMTISKVVSGTPTSLATTTFALGADFNYFTIRAEARGENLSAFWRGQLILTVQDTTYTGSGFVSLYMRSVLQGNPSCMRWEAGPLRPNYAAAHTPMAGPGTLSRRLR